MKPKPIRHFERYGIYSDGTVINLKTLKIIKPYPVAKGYLRVDLVDKNRRLQAYVHRLVAEAFLNNPHDYDQVNHKDGNKQNNDVNNLEWCSAEMNARHAAENGLTNNKKVELIAIQLKDLDRYPALADYAKRHGITPDEVRYRIVGTQRSDDVLLIRLDGQSK